MKAREGGGDDRMPASCPKRIGPYPVVREIGRGRMGVVYLAEDVRLRRQIAIKRLKARIAQDPSELLRFKREAQLLAAIHHPNIATVHSLEESEGLHFLTMELVTGETLRSRLLEGPLPRGQILSIHRQIAAALEAAHKKGVIHRDLKPLNIMITSEGVVKVLDFGLAKAPPKASDETADFLRDGSSPGVIVGTPGYMSPEQLRGMEIDHRSDIWAFGCILYECLTGRMAFPGDSHSDRIARTLEHEPDWTLLPPQTPERLHELVVRCTAKEIDERPESMAEARREIEEEIAQRAFSPRPRRRRKSPAGNPSNLPTQISSFIGRKKEITEVTRMLGETRLLTLTGAGGCGKTRLALEVGAMLLEQYRDGVWLVELAPLNDAERVAQVAATAMRVKEEPGRELIRTLSEFVEDKSLLLILDNCEHLLPACAGLSLALLRRGPKVRVLATSRQPLGITGEVVSRVPALAVPEAGRELSLDELREIEAVQLLADRAHAVNREFALSETNAPAVTQVCRRLDGIPLALELAAARVKVMTLDEIAGRLDDRFRLLTAGSKSSWPHHQTLRALIDWSYDQLPRDEQTLLRGLSVFAGGWSLESAEAVCAGSGIESWDVLGLHANLVDKSLVEMDSKARTETGRARYRMLETVRQYAWVRMLEKGEAVEARSRHRDFFLKVAEDTSGHLDGAEQTIWFTRLKTDHENLRLALETCIKEDPDPETGMRLMAALSRYWFLLGHWHEARRLCGELLARPSPAMGTAPRGRVLNLAGNLAFWQGEFESARASHEEALAIRRSLNDPGGIAASLNNLGNVAERQGDYARAQTYYEESLRLRRETGDERGTATLLHNLGFIAENQQDFYTARELCEESLAIRRKYDDRAGVAMSLNSLGNVAYWIGEYAKARALQEESLAIHRDLKDRYGVALSQHSLGLVATRQDEVVEARALLSESLSARRDLGDQPGTAMVLEAIGILAAATRQPRRAARLFGAAEALRDAIRQPHSPPERAELIRETDLLRSTLDETTFAAEWARGRAMPPEQAIAYALEDGRA